jgi:hypothetical protein
MECGWLWQSEYEEGDIQKVWVGPSLKVERVENNLIKVKVYLKNTKVEYIEKLMFTFISLVCKLN